MAIFSSLISEWCRECTSVLLDNNKNLRGNKCEISNRKIGQTKENGRESATFSRFALAFRTLNNCLHSRAILLHSSVSKKLLFDRKMFGISSSQQIPMKSDSHVGILSHISLLIQIHKCTHAVLIARCTYVLLTLHSTIPFNVTNINIH